MTFAIRVHENGGPEKLLWQDVGPAPKPGATEALVRNHAVGLNFIDIYIRRGTPYSEKLPYTPGAEGAGIVEAIGSDVQGIKVGDRVAYVGKIGSYAQYNVLPADRLVKIPDEIDFKTAAAIMLKGMTAEYLLLRTYKVKKGDTILMHAAAGGVGQLVCQWAKHLGAIVIGTVGSEEKVALAKQYGCAHVIVTNKPFAAEVLELTSGNGVQVVYDGVGKDTFIASVDCLAPLGLIANFGSASGEIPPFSISTLGAKSLYVTRPSLFTYTAKNADLQKSASELFAVIKQGVVKVAINQTYALQDAAQAQRDLETRKTTGSTVLLVD